MSQHFPAVKDGLLLTCLLINLGTVPSGVPSCSLAAMLSAITFGIIRTCDGIHMKISLETRMPRRALYRLATRWVRAVPDYTPRPWCHLGLLDDDRGHRRNLYVKSARPPA
eukprot:6114732-Pleurochrysis_carterae.AAC.1